jgi:hypothetical protein
MIKLKQLLLESELGDCYVAAARLASSFYGDDKGKVKLVHGMVNGQGTLEGKRYGHAWVEYGNKVLDHSNGRKLEIPKSTYYAIGKVDPSQNKYYTPEETMKWMMKAKHYGPWEITGDTVMAEDIPDDKREIGKKKVPIPRDVLIQL